MFQKLFLLVIVIFSSPQTHASEAVFLLFEKYEEALKNKHPDEANKILNEHPELYKERDVKGDTVLTIAALHDLSICKKIVEKHPELVKVNNDFGLLPIHAAASGGDRATIEYFAKIAPSTLKAKAMAAYEGMQPIHMATLGANDETTLALLKLDPKLITEKDSGGSLPMHHGAIELKPETLDVMYKLYPEAIHKKNQQGNLPIHLASALPGKGGLDYLIKKDQKTLMAQNLVGETPLHWAVVGEQVEHVKKIITVAPKTAGLKNYQGKTPAEMSNNLEIREEFINIDPQVLRKLDDTSIFYYINKPVEDRQNIRQGLYHIIDVLKQTNSENGDVSAKLSLTFARLSQVNDQGFLTEKWNSHELIGVLEPYLHALNEWPSWEKQDAPKSQKALKYYHQFLVNLFVAQAIVQKAALLKDASILNCLYSKAEQAQEPFKKESIQKLISELEKKEPFATLKAANLSIEVHQKACKAWLDASFAEKALPEEHKLEAIVDEGEENSPVHW